MVKSRTVTCVTLQPQKNYLPVTAFSHRFHIRPVQYNHPVGMRQVPPAGQGAGKSPVMRGGIRPNVCTGSRGFWPVRFFFIRQSSNIDSLFISTGPGGPFPKGKGAAAGFVGWRGGGPLPLFFFLAGGGGWESPLPFSYSLKQEKGRANCLLIRPMCSPTKGAGVLSVSYVGKNDAQNEKNYNGNTPYPQSLLF